MVLLLKGPFDDLRREIEKILSLPYGSTNPGGKFPSPVETAEKVVRDIENFLRKRRIK